MATKLISMGSKHGPAPVGIPTISVTHFANPWNDPQTRPLSGLDYNVAEYIRYNTLDFHAKVQYLLNKVQDYPGPVCLVCRGGRHRSVFLAALVGLKLNIPVEHRDLDKTDLDKTDS